MVEIDLRCARPLCDLRSARLRRGLTLEKTSLASGISLAWLSRVERCIVPLSEKSAATLAPVLGVDAGDLLKGQMALAVELRRELLAGLSEVPRA